MQINILYLHPKRYKMTRVWFYFCPLASSSVLVSFSWIVTVLSSVALSTASLILFFTYIPVLFSLLFTLCNCLCPRTCLSPPCDRTANPRGFFLLVPPGWVLLLRMHVRGFLGRLDSFPLAIFVLP